LLKRLEDYRSQERELNWEGTFGDYFEIVTKNPKVARLSHGRIYDMMMSAGVDIGKNGEPHYRFFNDEIFGLERPLGQVVQYFAGTRRFAGGHRT